MPDEVAGDEIVARPGWPGPDGGDGGVVDELAKGLADLSEVDDSSAFPWRMNAKLVIKFRDSGGTIRYGSCSGSMVDAESVLTAGHCVYAHNLWIDGVPHDVHDYALDVWVYPGWTGTGTNNEGLPAVNEVIEPYGYGHGTFTSTTLDWQFDENYDGDLGMVRIDRAVGMLTGWYGTANGGSCSWIQAQTYHNASFPSEYCGQPGMYNGLSMYYWYGVVDACPNNQLQFLVTGGCENNGWKGMSGSGTYYIQDQTRFVHAVASTRNFDYDIEFCRITGTFAGWLYDTFIPATRGATLDLQALDVTGPESGIVAGAQLPTSTVFITNPTNGSAAGTWTFRVYLSTDHYITSSDTLLGTYAFYADYSAMESLQVTMNPAPVIPVNTPSNFYYLGAILDPATDGNADNNATQGWDAQRFSVFGVPDLVAVSVDAPAGSHRIGEQMQVAIEALNQGSYHSGDFTVEVRASLNTWISAADTLLGSFSFTALDGGATLTDSVTVTIPAAIWSGLYYVGMIVKDSSDEYPDNNTAYDPTRITVLGFDIFSDGFESGSLGSWSSSSP